MASVYDAADLFLFPTLFDPFPLATLEALSAGLPVITTPDNGVSEIMTSGVHGTIIAEASDIASLSDALRKWFSVLTDPNHGPMTQASCSELASQFTLQRNLRETLEVIRELTAKR